MDNFAAIEPVLDGMSAEELISAGEYIFQQLKKQPASAVDATQPAEETEAGLHSSLSHNPPNQVMADHGEPPQSTSGRGKEEPPFRFFDLPRELRDWCYDYMTGPTVELESTREREDFDSDIDSDTENSSENTVWDINAVKAAIRAPPLINVLSVSRKVNDEYKQRAEKQTTLVFFDHVHNAWPAFYPETVGLKNFDWVTRVELFGMVKYPATIAVWLEDVAALFGKAAAMHIHLALECNWVDGKCEWPDYPEFAEVQSDLGRIVAGKNRVAQLDILRCELGDYNMEYLPRECQLCARWTKNNGWVVPEPAEEVIVENMSCISRWK